MINIIKTLKMIYEALFSPSPHDEIYKLSEDFTVEDPFQRTIGEF
jgi:hypothetical protein